MSNLTKAILEHVTALVPRFEAVLAQSSGFEIKGILNSEMLLFVTLLDLLKADHIIESGRARAQSTEIIARWLAENAPASRFDSIEFDAISDDIKVARHRIQATNYPVNAIFGNSIELLPGLVKEFAGKTIVLIDGPKGTDAAYLALAMLANERVIAVCVHDVHKDDAPLRAALELWPKFLASDNEQFVKSFSVLDKLCWAEHQKYEAFRGWGPYKRAERVMKSYGPTLVCLVNDIELSERQQAIAQIRKALASISRRLRLLRLISTLVPRTVKKNAQLRKLAIRLLS